MKVFSFFLFAIFLSSCGYKVGNLHRSIPGKHEKIAVPSFKNSTMEVGLESFFTKAIIEELIRADFVRVVSQKDADVVLEGTVVSVKYESSGALTNATITELPDNAVINSSYDTTVVVNLKLRQVSDNKIVWSGNFSGTKNIRAAQIGTIGSNSANPNYDYSAKQYTMGVLGKQLMSEAYSRMTEGF